MLTKANIAFINVNININIIRLNSGNDSIVEYENHHTDHPKTYY